MLHRRVSAAAAPRLERLVPGRIRGCARPHRIQPLLASASGTGKTAGTEEASEDAKSDEYSKEMTQKMGAALTYSHEAGINFDRVLPDLIVGSCLQTAADVDRLAEEEGVTTVFCLQEDSDLEYFGIDMAAIKARCKERGDIRHVRFRIADFNPFDLRGKLPKAVTRLAKAHDPAAGGSVYIHCTAGLGRAPAAAVAYMAWVRGMQVDEALAMTKAARACAPKIEAIRSATADLLLGLSPVETTLAVYRHEASSRVQVAGLDVGWHNPVDLEWSRQLQRFELRRTMLPGTYQYKFIVDGNWSYSGDHPTVRDGDSTNNLFEVIGASSPETASTLRRILAIGCELTQAEKDELMSMLCPWSTHGAGPNMRPGLVALGSLNSMDEADAWQPPPVGGLP
ncbi:hypothetical protein FOA52_008378 [Chlamydomonas sp. UWO 241]|nr:hypothetical protein FOA52_008378 [Chlamydomonas sp. UWO 241]